MPNKKEAKQFAKDETPSEHKKKHASNTKKMFDALKEKEQKEKEEAFAEMIKQKLAPEDEEVPQGDEPGHGEECEHCRRY